MLRCALQTRWAQQLHRLLRLYRRKLSVEVPWRPFYSMLRGLFMEPSAGYEGESWGLAELVIGIAPSTACCAGCSWSRGPTTRVSNSCWG